MAQSSHQRSRSRFPAEPLSVRYHVHPVSPVESVRSAGGVRHRSGARSSVAVPRIRRARCDRPDWVRRVGGSDSVARRKVGRHGHRNRPTNDTPGTAGDRARQAGRVARVLPRVDVRLPHPVGGAVRHLQPDPGRDPQRHGRSDGHQPRHPRLDRHRQHLRHAQRDVRQPHDLLDGSRRFGGAGHQRQADHAGHDARVDPRHPRARQRTQRRLQGLDDHAAVGVEVAPRGARRRLRPEGAQDDR